MLIRVAASADKSAELLVLKDHLRDEFFTLKGYKVVSCVCHYVVGKSRYKS